MPRQAGRYAPASIGVYREFSLDTRVRPAVSTSPIRRRAATGAGNPRRKRRAPCGAGPRGVRRPARKSILTITHLTYHLT